MSESTLLTHLLRWLIPAFFLFASGVARAALVEDLYTIVLPVPDQTTTQRLEVFNEAFREVVVKVSGSSEALANPGLARPLKNSSRYVLQFRYINRKSDADESGEAGQLLLSTTFNQNLLEQLLRENQVPIWGKERPSTLFLVSFDVNKNVALVSGDTTPEITDELEQAAQRKGLPVLFPLLDLEDRVLLGVADVIELNEENIMALADRYGPDAVLVGQITGRVGKGWHGSWQLRLATRIFNWEFRGKTRGELIDSAVAQLARTLATEYALETVEITEDDVLLQISEMGGLQDHQRTALYLQSLDAVKSVRLVLIHEDRVTYRIALRHSVQDLQQLISLGSRLEQLEYPQIDTTSEDQTILMRYRLLR
jgi:hypothetical protein